jgi:hypothetical protein
MTGQPPENTERIYTGQYGEYGQDPFGESQYAAPSPFGEPRYREAPPPGGPVSYDTTAYEFPPMQQQGTGPQPGYPGTGPQTGFPGVEAQTGFQDSGPQQPGGGHAARQRQRQRPGTPDAVKGMTSLLLDFDFGQSMTPQAIRTLYMLTVTALAVGALGFVVLAFTTSMLFGVIALFILAPAGFALGAGFARVILDFYLVVTRAREVKDSHGV